MEITDPQGFLGEKKRIEEDARAKNISISYDFNKKNSLRIFYSTYGARLHSPELPQTVKNFQSNVNSFLKTHQSELQKIINRNRSKVDLTSDPI
jgi:hypothetical protein